MRMIVIISDKEKQEYSDFMAETLETFSKHNVKGIAIVALCDEVNLTGYWNMPLRDKAQAENEIRYDVIDSLIMANKDICLMKQNN